MSRNKRLTKDKGKKFLVFIKISLLSDIFSIFYELNSHEVVE